MINLDKDDFHIVTYGGSKTNRTVMLFGPNSGVKYQFARRGSVTQNRKQLPRWRTTSVRSWLKLEFVGQFRKEKVKEFFEQQLQRSRSMQADVFRKIFGKKSKFE